MFKLFENLFSLFDTPEEQYDKKNILYGVSLDEYHYLGDTQVNSLVYAAFFCAKDDESDRVYVLVGSDYLMRSAKDSIFVKRNIAVWQSGVEHIANPIRNPSSYFKNYMLKTCSMDWSERDRWWVPSKEQLKKNLKNVAKTATMNGENIVPFKKD